MPDTMITAPPRADAAIEEKWTGLMAAYRDLERVCSSEPANDTSGDWKAAEKRALNALSKAETAFYKTPARTPRAMSLKLQGLLTTRSSELGSVQRAILTETVDFLGKMTEERPVLPDPMVAAWAEFEAAEAAQMTACNAYCAAEAAAFASHPPRPDGDDDLQAWRAACEEINARHGLPALSRAQDKAGEAHKNALDRVMSTKPKTVLGLLVQILAGDDADHFMDDFGAEAKVDARRAIGDLVRQLEGRTKALTEYRV